jgi:hypothetical protein
MPNVLVLTGRYRQEFWYRYKRPGHCEFPSDLYQEIRDQLVEQFKSLALLTLLDTHDWEEIKDKSREPDLRFGTSLDH